MKNVCQSDPPASILQFSQCSWPAKVESYIYSVQLFLHNKVHATHTLHRLTHILTQYGKPTEGPGCRWHQWSTGGGARHTHEISSFFHFMLWFIFSLNFIRKSWSKIKDCIKCKKKNKKKLYEAQWRLTILVVWAKTLLLGCRWFFYLYKHI